MTKRGNFIEDFYYGRLEPMRTNDRETAGLLQHRLRQAESELQGVLDDSSHLILREYEALWEDVLSFSEKESFVRGFRMGAAFMREVQG